MPVVIELELERSDHAEIAVKATLVEPVDVLDRRDLEVLHIVSGPQVRSSFASETDLRPPGGS